MKLHWIIATLACAAAFGAHAQYKYIGPDGRVVYSDQPPPPSAKVLKKDAGPGAQASSGGDLPFALQKAMKAAPVTLYTSTACGAPCTDAKSFLNQRGVPFTEKTVNTPEDGTEFRKTVNSEFLPTMVVGGTKQTQWERGAWETALNAAGYPAENQLPRTYRNPAPVAVAQPAPAAPAPNAPQNNTAAAPAAPASPGAPPPAAGGDKPGWFKGF